MSDNKKPRSRFAQSGVLLVDDQKPARMLLKSFLLRLGVGKVEEATDSIEALRILMQTPPAQCPFGTVFISRNMREMSGLQLVKNIRQLSGWGGFPIVVLSEDLDPTLIRDAASAGANEYLLRPYDEDQLKTILERVLA